MRLTNVCLLTDRLPALRQYYEEVLGVVADRWGDDYAELKLGDATLSLFARRLHEDLAPGSSGEPPNPAMLTEVRVDDVDGLHDRLVAEGRTIVKPPTTQPWGNRSIYVRDPDGNLIAFYTRVAES